MASFDDFIDAIKAGSKDLAKELFNGFKNEATEDASLFLEKTKQDMQRWTKLLSQGELTEQDFADLVLAKEALLEIHNLRKEGVSLAVQEKFRTGFIKLVINSAVNVFL